MVTRCPKGKQRFPAKTGKCYNKDGSDIPDGEAMEAEIERLKAEIRELRAKAPVAKQKKPTKTISEKNKVENLRPSQFTSFSQIEKLTEKYGGYEFFYYILGKNGVRDWLEDSVFFAYNGKQDARCEAKSIKQITFKSLLNNVNKMPFYFNEVILSALTKKDLDIVKSAVQKINKKRDGKRLLLQDGTDLHNFFQVMIMVEEDGKKFCWSGVLGFDLPPNFRVVKEQGFLKREDVYVEPSQGLLSEGTKPIMRETHYTELPTIEQEEERKRKDEILPNRGRFLQFQLECHAE